MLPDLALRAAERGAVGAEKHRARRRRALVDDDDLFRHGVHPLPFALSLSKGRSFFIGCPKRRTVLRQAQHERRRGAIPHHAIILQLPATHAIRSEEHTSELQSLMRISYAVFCLKKKKTLNTT